MCSLEEKILMINNGQVVNPFQVEIHLSNFCNHNCKWCIYKELRKDEKSVLPYKIADRLISNLKEVNCESILFSGGGDPLTYNNIENLLYKSYKLGMQNTLITNGGLLYEKDLEKILVSCRNIRISLDSYDDKSHKEIHSPLNCKYDNFHSICNTINNMVRINKYGSRITLSYILDDVSIYGLKEFINLSIDLKVNAIDIKTQHMLPVKERKLLSKESKRIISNCDLGNIKIYYDEVKRRTEFNNSKWIGLCYKCVIESNGGIYPCCHKIEEKFKIGNILKDDFNVLWGGKRQLEVIKKYYGENICCQSCYDSADSIIIRRILNKMNYCNKK